MKNIVFLLGDYHPKQSSNAICVKHIVDIIKINHKVSVVSFKQNIEQPYFEPIDNVDIYYIKNKIKEIKIHAEANQFFFKIKLINSLIIFLIRAYLFLKAILNIRNINYSISNSYVDTLKQIKKKNQIDVIIPVCFPFESIIAANHFKRECSNILVVPYLFDSFPESISLNRFKFLMKIKKHNHTKIFLKYLNLSDYVLAMNSFTGKLNNLLVDYSFIEHPLLFDYNLSCEKEVNNKITFVYAGSLNKNVRDPFVIIDFLSKIKLDDFDLILNFYTQGDYVNQLKRVSTVYSNLKINTYNIIPFDQILNILNSSNFLLNISDQSGIQISGKIFTYMSLGKPIINFYNKENDNTKKILDKYPLALSINKFSKISELESFIKENKNKSLDFNDLKKIYPDALPTYTAHKINDVINK